METKFRVKSHDPYLAKNQTGDIGMFNRSYEAQEIHTESNRPYYPHLGFNRFGRWGQMKDIGGPFLSYKARQELERWEPYDLYRDRGRYGIYSRRTMLYPNSVYLNLAHQSDGSQNAKETAQTWLGNSVPAAMPDFDLDAYGTTAISRCQPLNPTFDAATTIAELISERKFFALPGKNGGVSGEWLNYQLAIAPVVGGAKDLSEAIRTSDEVLNQLERDSGRLVRRRYRFDEELETTRSHVDNSNVYDRVDTFNTSTLDQYGSVTTVLKTKRTVWFSGAFTYHIPKSGWRRTLAEFERLYGVKPGVDTLWELVPFSFVADYFANLGDVLGNLNTFMSDGLVMPYGYVMCKTEVEREDTAVYRGWVGNVYQPIVVRGKYFSTTLQRRAANPFGFGIADNELTLRQLSILAALGISRK